MNLNKLFETQRVLDARIEKEHPRVEGEDRLAKKILALQVELGELANEWRGFKFWSNDQKTRGQGNYLEYGCKCEGFENRWVEKNPLLEEYVDCLHFILSIGLDLKLDDRSNSLVFSIEDEIENLVLIFQEVLSHTSDLFWSHYNGDDYETEEFSYKRILSNFLKLGDIVGFTWEQIEGAYYEKNEVNHERQNTGY